LYLFPKVTRRGQQLLTLDIAVRRPDIAVEPEEVIGIYIEDGIAKLATSENVEGPVTPADWVEVRALDFAKDVSVVFDGEWQAAPNGKQIFRTIGEPWLFVVTPGGELYTMQGDEGAQIQLAETDVVKLDAVKGWFDTKTPTTDQGIVAAYIKSNGNVYYRSYCTQADGTKLWDVERVLDELGTAVDVKIFRTNDFRLCFLISDGVNVRMHVSKRTWASMSVEPEIVDVSINDIKAVFTQVNFMDVYGEGDVVDLSMSATVLFSYNGATYNILSVTNPDAFTVILELDHRLKDVAPADFSFIDSEGTRFPITEVIKVGPGNLLAESTVYKLVVEDFNNAYEDVTVQCLAVGTTGEAGQAITPFSTVFRPTGLVPVFYPKPEPALAFNEEV
jgi:hypothetical protein